MAINPVYKPDIPLSAGIGAWFADMTIVLVLSAQPVTRRLGILISGLFFAVPCFLWASPLSRALLMCCMAFPFTIATALLIAPSTAGFRGRLEYFFAWMGTRTIERNKRGFDIASLLRLIAAAMVFAMGLACLKAVSAAGIWLLLRWFAGAVMILAFAEMASASHDWLTALMGVNAPSLMRSPFLSKSVTEFWTKRWNVAASELGFGPLCFTPLARHGVVLALFAAFTASAVGHVLLAFMAMGRWRISISCGAFFIVQPLLIVAERKIKVKRWPTTAARAWTVAALGVTSPLFVGPVIQLITPSLGVTDNLLSPTIAAFSFALVVNFFFSAGQVAFCVKRPPPHRVFGATNLPRTT
jgi:hypothetical protein